MIFAKFKNGVEIKPGDSLYRIVSYGGNVYVYKCPVFYCKRFSARIVAAISECVSNGMKPERIGQFNQSDRRHYVMITTDARLVEDLEFFQNKVRPKYVIYQDCHEHPLWDTRREKAECGGFIQ